MSDEAPEIDDEEELDTEDAPESEVDDVVLDDTPATDPVADQPAAPDWGPVAEYIGAESADPAIVRQRLEAFGQQQHALMEQNRQLTRQAEEAAYWRLRAQEQSAAQQPAKAPEKPKWEVPEYNPEWANLVRLDPETQRYVALPGAQPDLPQKIEAYAKWQRQQQQALYANPAEYMLNTAGLREQIQVEARAIAEQVMVQNRQQFDNQRYIEENATRFFTPDGGMTSEGQAFGYYLQEAKEMGMPGPAIRKYAETQVQLLALQGQVASQQPAAQPTPSQVQAEKNKAFVAAGAGRKPNRAGTVPRPNQPHAPVQNGRLSLKQMMTAALDRDGITDADFNK